MNRQMWQPSVAETNFTLDRGWENFTHRGGARAVAARARAHLEERCVRHVLLVRRPHQQDYGGQPKQQRHGGRPARSQAAARLAPSGTERLEADPSSGPLKKEAETDVGPEGLSHQRRRDFWFERAR